MLSDHEVFDGCCGCHSHPPCSWCMSLTLEEADAMWSGGREALEKYWKDSGYVRKKEDNEG